MKSLVNSTKLKTSKHLLVGTLLAVILALASVSLLLFVLLQQKRLDFNTANPPTSLKALINTQELTGIITVISGNQITISSKNTTTVVRVVIQTRLEKIQLASTSNLRLDQSVLISTEDNLLSIKILDPQIAQIRTGQNPNKSSNKEALSRAFGTVTTISESGFNVRSSEGQTKQYSFSEVRRIQIILPLKLTDLKIGDEIKALYRSNTTELRARLIQLAP